MIFKTIYKEIASPKEVFLTKIRPTVYNNLGHKPGRLNYSPEDTACYIIK